MCWLSMGGAQVEEREGALIRTHARLGPSHHGRAVEHSGVDRGLSKKGSDLHQVDDPGPWHLGSDHNEQRGLGATLYVRVA